MVNLADVDRVDPHGRADLAVKDGGVKYYVFAGINQLVPRGRLYRTGAGPWER